VSHELRTPVTVVLGTSELLAGRTDRMAADDARLLALLDDQVGRLARTVLDLLDLYATSSEDGTSFEAIDIADVAQEVLADRGIDLPVSTAGADRTTVTDVRRLTRILANLVDNAQSHGGQLTGLSVDGSADHVEITVDDDGDGILEEERERVFEPFQRGSSAEAGSGSGLGLAIVREQSRAIGATVEVSDAPGGGARFLVVQPREVR
jgi:signal transduction histidine kinase